jgi:hypothetical protein
LDGARISHLSSISYGELAPYLRAFNSQGLIYSSDRGMIMYVDVWTPEFRKKSLQKDS